MFVREPPAGWHFADRKCRDTRQGKCVRHGKQSVGRLSAGGYPITATYFDPMDIFVCSGTVTISQSAHVQNTFLEFRPYELEIFLKWWDAATLKQQALLCRDYQGNEMRNPTDFATSLRVYATVFPKRGGLSTSEIQINLPRFQRP